MVSLVYVGRGYQVRAYVLRAPCATINAWIDCIFPPFRALIPVSCPYINGYTRPLEAVFLYSST